MKKVMAGCSPPQETRGDHVLYVGAQPYATGTRFRVWAPYHERVEVVVFRGDGPDAIYKLEHIKEGYFGRYVDGIFGADIDKVRLGDLYKYRLDGGDSFPDPASRYQPDGVHGASQVVDPNVFTWTDLDWRGVSLEDLVIYELHVGTATQEGTFDALITYLGAIKDLGATAILLMAIADFPGDRNWGYDGVNLFAPARAYGGPEALRRLVNAAHSCYGLAVILDVVFNHLGPDGNYLAKFSESYFSKAHVTPWGPGINYSGVAGRPVCDLIVANCRHWAWEYHVDGLRLDAIQAIKDTEEPNIVAKIVTDMRNILPPERSFLVIAEDEYNKPELVRPREQHGCGLDAVYADDFHHQLHVALTGETTGYYVDYKGTSEDLAATMRQSWWFTGELVSQWRKDEEGRPSRVGEPADDIPRKHFIWCLQNHDQVGNRPLGERLNHLVDLDTYRAASALLLLSPHTPLLFMGQEWAASTPFLYFTDHHDELGQSVTEGRFNDLERRFPGYDRSRAPKPQDRSTFLKSKLQWQERSLDDHAGIFRLYRDLLRLRREQRALRSETRDAFTAEAIPPHALALSWRVTEPEDELFAIANLRGRLSLPLAKAFARLRSAAKGWMQLLDTEDPKYGGCGGTRLSLTDDARLEMGQPGLILLGLRTDQQQGKNAPTFQSERVGNGGSYDYFLSFSTINRDQAREIQRCAEEAGLKIFLSERKVRAGDVWDEKVRAALKGSRRLALLASPDSLKSEWVVTEWGAAWMLGKPITPIIFRCDVSSLPERLRRYQAIDFDEFLKTLRPKRDPGAV